MRPNISIIVGFALLLVQPVKSQEFDKLTELKNNSFPVYYSTGNKQRTTTLAQRVEKAMSYHQQTLGMKPAFTLLVLSKDDWSTYTDFPVYGMPHFNNQGKRLIIAAEDNEYWKSFLPPLDQLPQPLREKISATYKIEDGGISMRPFFDLLVLHELGHAYHIQGGLTMQRKWMGELFCNIFLHTYIADKEPELLSVLTLFPQMVVGAGSKEFTFTSLEDIEERYEEIGKQHPKNYGWYQCRWHIAAGNIYDAGGKDALSKLWSMLIAQKEILTDDQLIALLEKSGCQKLGDMMKNWNRDTVREPAPASNRN